MVKKSEIKSLRKFFLKKLVLCGLMAMLLTILNYYAIYLPFLTADPEAIVKSTTFKKQIRENEKRQNNLNYKRISDDFVVIDVSKDATVYCDTARANNFGLPIDSGTVSSLPCYTSPDVKKLTQLFKWLASHTNQFKLVVCDLLFDKLERTSENDSLLGYLINLQSNTPRKIIFSSIYDEYNKKFQSSSFSKNLLDDCKGAVNEELSGNLLFKYNLSYNHGAIKSLPLLMYEKIKGYSVTHGNFGLDTYQKGDFKMRASNLFIPEMFFPLTDFDSLKLPGSQNGPVVDSSVSKMELWQTVLKFDDSSNYYLQQVLKPSCKKIIFIGSFNHSNTDVHKTLYGDMDGGIILINIYYNLVMKGNRISLAYNFFIFFCFVIISLLVLDPPKEFYNGRWLILRIALDIFLEELQYVVLLIMCVLSSVLFDKACNVVVLFLVIFLIGKITSAYKAHKAHKAGAHKKNPDKILQTDCS